jgi:hypothetical protein
LRRAATTIFILLTLSLFTIRPSGAEICDGRYDVQNSTSFLITGIIVTTTDGAVTDVLQGTNIGNKRPFAFQMPRGRGSLTFQIFFGPTRFIDGFIQNACANERSILVFHDARTHDVQWRLQ